MYVGQRVGPLSSQETRVQGPRDRELTSVNGLRRDTLLMIPFTISVILRGSHYLEFR